MAYLTGSNLTTPIVLLGNVSIDDKLFITGNTSDNMSTASGSFNLISFQDFYMPIHGVLAPIICVFGIIANCLNIVVLTRKNMTSPTNMLLTWLAISDGLTMGAYLPFSILNYHVYLNKPSPMANARFIMFYAIFSVVVHTIAIWLTVSLAVFRYVFIRFPRHGVKMCSLYRAKLTVFLVCLVVTIVTIPNSASYQFESMKMGNDTAWHIQRRMDTSAFRFLSTFNLWIQAILVKLFPCFLLAVLSILLIKEMKDAEKRRKKLMTKRNTPGDDDCGRQRKTNRTTRMLVAVVVLFTLTETPQGVLSFIAGIDADFFQNVYNPLGDLMDTLALFNNSINFVLYCTMSKQFRDTFVKLFIQELVKNNNGHSDGHLMASRGTRMTEAVTEV